MKHDGYRWRAMSADERARTLAARRSEGRPWHSPPHYDAMDARLFHVTAACYEHAPHIGRTPERLDEFCGALCDVLHIHATRTAAWCVLPNHYHVLVEASDIKRLTRALGRLHGRSSHSWNGEEGRRGRQVFRGAADRFMRSERHVWATVNYVLHNPVHHGYVGRWTDWPWSSAADYLALVGRDEARRRWLNHPPGKYGRGWDDPEM